MKKLVKIFFIPLFFTVVPITSSQIDVSLVGPIKFADGIGRQVISFSECLDDLSVNILPTRGHVELQDIPAEVVAKIEYNTEKYGEVLLYADTLDNFPEDLKNCTSKLKIAYTMYEKTTIPQAWVDILNNHFDMAVVPDDFLVEVYQNSGVKIPVFVLAIPLYLEPFLEASNKFFPNEPFVFGTSGFFSERKNHLLVLESFAKEFGNSTKAFLKIHGRGGVEWAKKIKDRVKELALENVEVIEESLSWNNFIEYMKSLDCFVLLSRGEGFSITPREAMALGIPCILSDNTGHHTLCKSGLVTAVPCHKIDKTRGYEDHEPFEFDCFIDDVVSAMKNMFHSFFGYLKDSILGRLWVKKYLRRNLRKKYANMVKPTIVIKGPYNKIGKRFIMTDSKELYDKYQEVKESIWPW